MTGMDRKQVDQAREHPTTPSTLNCAHEHSMLAYACSLFSCMWADLRQRQCVC